MFCPICSNPEKSPFVRADVRADKKSVASCVTSRSTGARKSDNAICTPSNADFINVISPERLSSCVSAMACAAPVVLSNAPCKSSRSPPRAFTTSSYDVSASVASHRKSAKSDALPADSLRIWLNVSSDTPRAFIFFCISAVESPVSWSASFNELSEYHAPSIARDNSSHRSPVVASNALTVARSVLLNMADRICVRSCELMPSRLADNS